MMEWKGIFSWLTPAFVDLNVAIGTNTTYQWVAFPLECQIPKLTQLYKGLRGIRFFFFQEEILKATHLAFFCFFRPVFISIICCCRIFHSLERETYGYSFTKNANLIACDKWRQTDCYASPKKRAEKEEFVEGSSLCDRFHFIGMQRFEQGIWSVLFIHKLLDNLSTERSSINFSVNPGRLFFGTIWDLKICLSLIL